MRFASTVCTTLIVVTLVGIGCGPSEAESDATADRWTVERGDIQLEEEFSVMEAEDFFFGSIADVAVDSEGRIYVADAGEQHVKVLSPEGELLETIGQEGEGPGEFQRPHDIYVGRGDSVYVMDAQQRITVFSPESYEVAYLVTLGAIESRFPTSLFAGAQEEGFFVEYRASVRDPDTRSAVHRVGYDGEPDESAVFTLQDGELLFDDSGDIPRAMPKPFSRGSRVAVGPEGRIYHGTTGTLAVDIYARDGLRVDTVAIPYTPVPVTGRDVAYEKERYDNEWASRMIDNADLDDTKPVFSTLLVDDRGQLWFKRATDDPEQADWWIADPTAEQVAVVSLPSEIDLMAVRDGYAYGRAQNTGSAPALVRYRIQK